MKSERSTVKVDIPAVNFIDDYGNIFKTIRLSSGYHVLYSFIQKENTNGIRTMEDNIYLRYRIPGRAGVEDIETILPHRFLDGITVDFSKNLTGDINISINSSNERFMHTNIIFPDRKNEKYINVEITDISNGIYIADKIGWHNLFKNRESIKKVSVKSVNRDYYYINASNLSLENLEIEEDSTRYVMLRQNKHSHISYLWLPDIIALSSSSYGYKFIDNIVLAKKDLNKLAKSILSIISGNFDELLPKIGEFLTKSNLTADELDTLFLRMSVSESSIIDRVARIIKSVKQRKRYQEKKAGATNGE